MAIQKGFQKRHHPRNEIKKGQTGKRHPAFGKHWKVKDTSKMSEAAKLGWKKTNYKRRGLGNKGKHYKIKYYNPNSGFRKGNKVGNRFQKENEYRFKKGQKSKNWKGFQQGNKHLNWIGGISFEPYGLEFNKQLKEKIRQRDQFRCQQCFRHQDELRTKTNKPYKLVIHHIDYCKQNNNPNNLISLCRNCHSQSNFVREDWTNYFKERLFNKEFKN